MTSNIAWMGIGVACLAIAAVAPRASRAADDKSEEKKVPLIFTGGHETDPRDHGRPVVLIAAALKVPDTVFRETFTHVKPARRDGGPTDEEARTNKAALMKGLGPYGVTNDRLNEVSNFYRYNGRKGEMWRNTPAEGFATVKDGVVQSITITKAGAGYSSEPKVTIAGMESAVLKATLSYGTKFDENGSVKEVVVAPARAAETQRSTTRPAQR